MKLLDAHAQLLALKQEVIQTADAAVYLKISIAHASRILRRLSDAGFFIALMRNKWACHSAIDPLVLPEYLTAPAPSYISFQSALYYGGMISQIPNTIYAASLARTCQFKTSIATISIHHIQPNFFFGFEFLKSNIRMATLEKALIDTLYLSSARSHLFSKLPELEIPRNFKAKEARKIVEKIPSPRMRTIVSKKLESLLRDYL